MEFLLSLVLTTSTPAVQTNQPPSPLSSVKVTTKNPLIQETFNNGRYIRLSDDSLWEINPTDTAITQGWITPVEIIVTPISNPVYTHRLTNSLTQSSVLARKVNAIPQTPQPSHPSTNN